MKAFVTGLFLFCCCFAHAEMPTVESYYDISAGSKNIRDVRVFLVGEVHTVGTDRQMFAHVVETFRSRDSMDYVLLEGFDSNSLNGSVDNLTSLGGEELYCPVRVLGWDDEWLFRLTKASFEVSLKAYQTLKSKEASLSLKAQALVRGLFQRYWRSTMFTDRNDSMMRTIEEVASQNSGKIFVLAGADHFTEDSRVAAFLTRKKISFSVLIPKPDHPLRIESMSGMDYIKELVGEK